MSKKLLRKHLNFFDSNKNIDLKGDILHMLTKYNFNAMSIEYPEDEKLLLDFLIETRFDVKHTGEKIIGDEGLIKIIEFLTIRASGFSVKFLSETLNEIFDRLILVLQGRKAGINFYTIDEKIIALLEKTKKYNYVCTKHI